MVRSYHQICDLKRARLIKLILENHITISTAAKMVDIPYDNAKVIYRIYRKENRVSKK